MERYRKMNKAQIQGQLESKEIDLIKLLRDHDFKSWNQLKAELHSKDPKTSIISKFEMENILSGAGVTDWTVAKEFNTKSFHPFPRLSPELQIMVWEFALPDPRVLRVDVKVPDRSRPPFNDWDRFEYWNWFKFNKAQRSPNPALLSTCHLSRNVAAKTYKLVFGTTNVYADLSRDIMYFVGSPKEGCQNFLLEYLFEQSHFGMRADETDPVVSELLEMTHVVLDSDNTYYYRIHDDEYWLREATALFPNLKRLSFSCGPSYFLHSGGEGQIALYKADHIPSLQSDYYSWEEAEEMRQNFHRSPCWAGEEQLSEEDLIKQTSREFETQVVNLSLVSNRELLREQELRTGTVQGNKELHFGPGDFVRLFPDF